MNNDNYLTFNALTLTGIKILDKINAILKAELLALKQRDLDKIKLCSSDKSKLLNDFSKNTAQRAELLKEYNYPSTAEGIQNFFSSSDSSVDIKQYKNSWKLLEKALKAVIQANAINEQVIIRSQKSIKGVLSILQGKQANNILYNAKGNKGDYAGQSRIGKA